MSGWNIKPPKIFKFISKNELELESKTLENCDRNVVVVTTFGPSQYFDPAIRASGYNKAFQLAVDAFGSLQLVSTLNASSHARDSDMGCGSSEVQKNLSTVTGFYNEDESLLILCLDGAYDPNMCLKAFHEVAGGNNFMMLWSQLKSSYCQALLLLFSLSHVMVLSSIGSYFDTSYIMLFRALEKFRYEMQPFIREVLEEIPGLPENWIENSRICSPRLLFLFPLERSNLKVRPENEHWENACFTKHKAKLENEIYQILRKCRIITNVSGHSLFAVPFDQEADFVNVYEDEPEEESSWAYYIKSFCESSNERVSGTLVSRSNITRANKTQKSAYRDNVRKFRSFLQSHVKVAKEKGFSDNAPRVDERKNFFVLPKLRDWIQAYKGLSNLLLNLKESQDLEYSCNKVLRKLPRYLDIDSEYLESQCNKGFQKVFSVYTKNIPAHYSEEEQGMRVNQAIDAFLSISRAPGIVPWLEKLAEKCDRFWKRGRQQCATRSLHRHLCTNPRHRIEPGDNLEILPQVVLDDSLPEMKHSIGNRLTSYCNCGRRSGTRDEPFTIREANYDFYQRLALECCEKLDAWKVPIFEHRRDEKGEGLTLEEMLRIFLEKKKGPGAQEAEEEEPNVSQSQVLERDLRQDEEEEVGDLELEMQEDHDDFAPPEELGNDEGGEDLKLAEIEEGVSGMGLSQEEVPATLLPITTAVERASPQLPPEGTHEFLPGMLHSRCPPGLLPLFPSWSLVKFGSSSLYAHTHGILHQPGFLAGAGFLLPWDVRVKAEAGVSKPVPRVIRGKVPSNRVKRFDTEFSVKVFIGFEYECRKGHRFMLETPDKVLHITNPNFGPSIRESATKVAKSDMPLYFKCPCNTTQVSVQVGQLMRIHVVTPKAPVHVTLNPRVQPAQGSPYFLVGNREPINLTPSTYWVLRLPYSYVSEEQIYTPPIEKETSSGRICKGLLDVVAMSRLETIQWESTNRVST